MRVPGPPRSFVPYYATGWIIVLALALAVCVFSPHPSAQTVLSAQIDSFSRALRAGQYQFSRLALTVGGYMNFGTTLGSGGYGIRDNAGEIQIKNSGGAWATPAGGATATATYIVKTAPGGGSLPNAQALGSLATGLLINTTTTGVLSAYAGGTCTNQFTRAISASGAVTCQSVALATDATGTLPAANLPAFTGDATSTVGTSALTLSNTGVGAATYGSSALIPVLAIDAKGRVTTASSTAPQLTLTSTYFSSLSGANLTALPAASLTGLLPAANFPAMTGDVTSSGGTLTTVVSKITGQTVSLAGALTTVGANAIVLTTTGATNITLPTSGTLVSSTTISLPSLATVGTIGTGVWNGTLIDGQYGGTGVANTGKTITLGGNLATSGAFNLTMTLTAGTTITLPTSGTLVSTSTTSLPNLTTVGTLTNVAGSGTIGTVASPYASAIIGTAATNNLTVTPASFGQGTVATVTDPGFTTAVLPLVKRGTIAFTATAIGGGACATVVTGALAGLATTSVIVASRNAALGTEWQKGAIFHLYPTANTVNLQVCNPTSGSITPETTTFNYLAVVP
jgi:hypothetical protein